MNGPSQCPICGGELQHKQVEKLLRGGPHTASVTVEADVCMKCGERLYDGDTIRFFEDIRRRLKSQDTSGLMAIGTSFEVHRKAG